MAGDKNCVAHGITNSGYESCNGIARQSLGSPFHKRLILPWWQWIKIILMTLTIVPIRLLLVGIFLSMTSFLAYVATCTSDTQKPMTGWRLWIKCLFCLSARTLFLVGGFHWISTKGRQSPVDEAPILVLAPHSSYLDSLIIVYLGMCSVVAKEETARVPIIGNLVLMTQPVLVSREERHSRRKTVDEIQRRAKKINSGWPQIAIFPEGTCTNRNCLIKFKLGAFIPGVPVQPVIIRWPNRVDTTVWTWDGPSTWTLLWLSLCQFHNYIAIEYLPIYNPNEEEASDPSLFASNVQSYISDHLRVPVSDYSYEDSRILDIGIKRGIPCAPVILEMLRLERIANVQNLKSLSKDLIPRYLTAPEFATAIGVPESPLLERVFIHYEAKRRSRVMDFRRFLLDLVIISDPKSIHEFFDWAFHIYSNQRDKLTCDHAEEIIAAVYPSFDRSEMHFLTSGCRHSSISLDGFHEDCQKLSHKFDNVYLKFHEQVARLKQCY